MTVDFFLTPHDHLQMRTSVSAELTKNKISMQNMNEWYLKYNSE